MLDKFLKDKKVLFIAVKFFNYETLISNELRRAGAIVDYIDERPSNSFFSKAIIRVKKEFYSYKINSYYKGLIDTLKNKQYDYFLLINGEAIPSFFIDFLRKNNPGIRMIYYTYDSFKNNPNGLDVYKKFDNCFTFDSEDAIKYNIAFRPLFYDSAYSDVRKSNEEIQYALAFIGTAHSDRYTLSQYLYNWCIQNKLKMFTFYFSPSKILFGFNRLFKKDFKNFDKEKISFNSLALRDIINVYKKSDAVLDINHPNQTGLTMRTFEVLGAGRKLVTTNFHIKKYPFYDERNICVIDRNNIVLDKVFFENTFVEVDSVIDHSMSLRGWIEDVFDGSNIDLWKDTLKY